MHSKNFPSPRLIVLTVFLVFASFSLVIVAQDLKPAGGGEYPRLPMDEMSDQQRLEIQQQLQESIRRLEAEGRFSNFSPFAVPLSWPVAKAPGAGDFSVDAISNFVDQNPSFPSQLLDYNCGTRTYDQASGYNHRGIDIFTWPFPWRKMDLNEAFAVAAAPGTIIFKSDGNFDRSCGFNSNSWNAVYVRHSDNSVAWYGHLKNGSLTPKAVGETVSAGEYLGVIGSSGNSTGPHLHFELFNAAGQLQDPYQGPCNTMNNFSWWAQQPEYRVTRMNQLMTQSAGPVFPGCPQQETTNEKTVFRGGNTLVTAGYYRDQMQGQQTQFSIIRPDGSTHTNWSHTSPNTYSASYWWWSWALPTNAPNGVWKLRAAFNAQNYEKKFVVPHSPFSFDTDRSADLVLTRPSQNRWHILSSAGYTAMDWGVAGDMPAPADYDGDGRTDIAIFRPSEGRWYVVMSQGGSFQSFNWGEAGDLPVPADHDGDGRFDLVVYRETNNTWYTRSIATGGISTRVFGQAGDKPLRGDFDADGIWDIAVFRPATRNWYIAKSTAGFFVQTWGEVGDIPVPADFDGDGAADLAIFRPATGQWYRIGSTTGFDVVNWGQPGDIPVPADYDGDGRADAAVFRPLNGTWYVINTTAGIQVRQFGQAGDLPAQSAFNY